MLRTLAFLLLGGALVNGDHRVACGRNRRCRREANRCEPDGKDHEVRCCAEKKPRKGRFHKKRGCNVYGASQVTKCYHAATYQEAHKICANVGARLCTEAELKKDCTRGTGCGHDGDLVWTKDTCGKTANTVPANTHTANTVPATANTAGNTSGVPAGYKKLGAGYCDHGYFAGWRKEDATLTACAKKCNSEEKCKFFALLKGKTCSRYTSKAGKCDPRKHGKNDHVTYAKIATAVKPAASNHGYKHIVKGCVNGHNIKKYPNKSVAQCVQLCDKNTKCKAFEYGVKHGGRGRYKERDCQLQSSAAYKGCNGAYHNLDLYIKPATPVKPAATAVKPAGEKQFVLAHKHTENKASNCPNLACTTLSGGLAACKAKCSGNDKCNLINFCPKGASCTSGANRCCMRNCDSLDDQKLTGRWKGWDIYTVKAVNTRPTAAVNTRPTAAVNTRPTAAVTHTKPATPAVNKPAPTHHKTSGLPAPTYTAPTAALAPGARGERGERGLRGERGEAGKPGMRGERGEQGKPGPMGRQGERGPQGKDGRDGKDGRMGHEGKRGQDGKPGHDGKPGQNGSQGAPGKDGHDGKPGHNGEDGKPGMNGHDGKPGMDGKPGLDGHNGVNGRNGKDGEAGPIGPIGPEGPAGMTGPEGRPGLNGHDGKDGLDGHVGAPGVAGHDGHNGMPGPIGPQGERGERGERGANGEHGAQGPAGPKGETGAPGHNGLRGEHGERGAEGEQGPEGPAGHDGHDGKPGLQGPKGEHGERGHDGVNGHNGKDGLRGERGEKGEQGERGERGAEGPQGPEGPSNTDEIERQIQETRDEIESQEDEENREIEESTQQTLAKIEENQKAIGENEEEIRDVRDNDLREIREDNENAIKDVKIQNQDELNSVRQDNENGLKEVRESNEREINDIRQNDLREIRESNEREMNNLRENELREIRERNENALREVREENERQLNEMRMENEREKNEMRQQIEELRNQSNDHHGDSEDHHDSNESDECEMNDMETDRCDFQFDIQHEGLTHSDEQFNFVNADLFIEGVNGVQSYVEMEHLALSHGTLKIGRANLHESILDLETIHGEKLHIDIEGLEITDSRLIVTGIHGVDSKLDIDGINMSKSRVELGKINLLKSSLELEPISAESGAIKLEAIDLSCSTLDMSSVNVNNGGIYLGHIKIADSTVTILPLELKEANLNIESLTAYGAEVYIDDKNYVLSTTAGATTQVEAIEVYGAKFTGWFTENGLEANCELTMNDGFCRVGQEVLAGSEMPEYQSDCQADPVPETPVHVCAVVDVEDFVREIEAHEELKVVCEALIENPDAFSSAFMTDNSRDAIDENCNCLSMVFSNDVYLEKVPECTVPATENSPKATLFNHINRGLDECRAN